MTHTNFSFLYKIYYKVERFLQVDFWTTFYRFVPVEMSSPLYSVPNSPDLLDTFSKVTPKVITDVLTEDTLETRSNWVSSWKFLHIF